jgi:hypothetical protein
MGKKKEPQSSDSEDFFSSLSMLLHETSLDLWRLKAVASKLRK